MSRFVVHFMKVVLGDNGREREVCQSALEIDASSEGQATEIAKLKFCQQKSLCDWSLHATASGSMRPTFTRDLTLSDHHSGRMRTAPLAALLAKAA